MTKKQHAIVIAAILAALATFVLLSIVFGPFENDICKTEPAGGLHRTINCPQEVQ